MTTLVTGGTHGIRYVVVEELVELLVVVYTYTRNMSELNQRLHEWSLADLTVSRSVCDTTSHTRTTCRKSIGNLKWKAKHSSKLKILIFYFVERLRHLTVEAG